MMSKRSFIRMQLEPRDLPPLYAARYLGLTLLQFEACQDALYLAGFPKPDPITGNYDSIAISRYLDRRSQLNGEVAKDARIVALDRIIRSRHEQH